MKKLLILLIAASGSLCAHAQDTTKHKFTHDADLGRWVIDLNLLGGGASQNFNTSATTASYLNPLNMNTGELKYRNGYSYGGDAQLGFFFGKKKHFGIGAGIMYMQQNGDAILNNYHVEYQATDGAGNVYRQLVTGNNVRENIISTMYNIPVVLKYKNRFSKHWGFTMDAGALINLQMKNAYTSYANFDYEAIYKFVNNDGGGQTSVYDNLPVPNSNDWMITKAEFYKNNPTANLQDYFSAKRALGYNVGTNLSPAQQKGNISYTQGSVGFIVQPSFNYFLSDKVALNFGGYYMLQPFKNNAQSNYRLTNGEGGYSSSLNSVTSSTNQAYGLNLGVRFFFGKKRAPLAITSMEQTAPSQCGLCDGGIILHGLTPNEPVNVDYSLNGGPTAKYATTVQPDGVVKINNLCAGTYTAISATIKRRNAAGQSITIADPVMSISSENITNPTITGTCNGAVLLNGLYAGKSVTINYYLDGAPQAAYTGVVNTDNSITLNNLCAGKYTGIVAKINTCVANGTDFALVAPAPPPPPPAPVVVEEPAYNAPILFDFNKATIHVSSYAQLNEESKELRKETDLYIRVDAYTDAIGSDAYNQKLSVRRANAVKTYLKKKGANPARIKIYGHGKKDPAADNSTDEGRSKNRRATINKVSGE